MPINDVMDDSSVTLREGVAKGVDANLQAASDRARLLETILAATSMVDQAQACTLLGQSTANPSATMKLKEDNKEILRFGIGGRAAYPLFQFDVEGCRIYPAISKLIVLKPDEWSAFRLLHWLTRPHLDFGDAPSEFLAQEEDVIAAFKREISSAEYDR